MRLEGEVTGARPLRRRELFTAPLIDGREVRDHSLARLRRRMGALLVSGSEREEADLERRLRAHPGVTRPNVVAVISPKGGVGKTTSAFVLANLLASHLKLHAIAVDASRSGTLGRFPADSARAAASSSADLLDRADGIGTAAELRAYVAQLPSGLHLLAAPRSSTLTPGSEPDHCGRLVALLSCFYEAVVLDLGPGVTGPLARLALDRADQALLVTTPDQLTATIAIHALDQLDRERATVVVNRSHPRLTPELRAIEECMERRDVRRPIAVPDDRRLSTMLQCGTYSLEALDRVTRLAVKRLGLAVAERLV